MHVPTASSLVHIYPEDAVAAQEHRWATFLALFKDEYGRPADLVSRSPGRVNLIGEHIDYSLYQVLPMAVTADVLVAVAMSPPSTASSAKVRLSNVDGSKFTTREFDVPAEGDIEIDPTSHEWSNYFKAGFQGACRLLRKRNANFVPVGMDVLVLGNVPTGSGLSSSTAFVCASALATMAANGEKEIDKSELCQLTIVSERAVGTNGGGMDQAASVFSLAGSATYISFVPELIAEPVKFPTSDPEFAFLIAQTYVDSFKHVTAPVCYNLRVVECTMATAFLAKVLNLQKALPTDISPLGISLRSLQNAYFEENNGIQDNFNTDTNEIRAQLEQMVSLVSDKLPQEEGYTREEISSQLGITVDELNERYMSRFIVRADRFKLRQRALHVFSEALRVIKFKSLLSSPDPSLSADEILRQLGTLMNEAQASNKDLYDCSCPELDQLCALAREAGALGSRLTGAGWGGSCVHLVPKDKIEAVTTAWKEKYYKTRWPDMSDEKLSEAIVVSEPGSGSFLYRVVGEI